MYAKIVNDVVIAYPYTRLMLKADNPNVSFPRELSEEILIDFNLYPVTNGEVPVFNEETHKLVQDSIPTNNNGTWELRYQAIPYTQEELALNLQGKILALEKNSARLFFRLCKVLIDNNLIDPQDPSMAEIKAAYQDWIALKAQQ